jgi:hypothetical protein
MGPNNGAPVRVKSRQRSQSPRHHDRDGSAVEATARTGASLRGSRHVTAAARKKPSESLSARDVSRELGEQVGIDEVTGRPAC